MILRVKDYMSAAVETTGPGASLFEAIGRMGDRGVRHLPVTDARGVLLGMVSDRDLRLAFPVDGELPVGELMSRELVTVFPEDSLAYAIDLFVSHRVGALPVVDGEAHIVGILSVYDVLEAIGRTVDIREGRAFVQRM